MADITKINLNGTELTIVDSAATSAIAGEIARAQGAESAITSALSAEVVARQSADTQIQTALSGKADASTTLSGYGITDAYTKTEVDTALAGKANTATTYTKSEVDTALAGKQNTLSAGTGIQISGDVISCTVDTGLYVVVTTLPAQPAAGNENKIHLVPLASGETQNMYAEYIWKGDAWEKLGEKQIDTDLTDYWTSAQTQSAITSATSGLASEEYVENSITLTIGEELRDAYTIQGAFEEANIGYYDSENEEYVVNPMASEDYVDGSVGIDILESEWSSVEGVLQQAGIAHYDSGNEEYVVNEVITTDTIESDMEVFANASYNAQTETLIINLPTTPA
jgi:hypothetical protein